MMARFQLYEREGVPLNEFQLWWKRLDDTYEKYMRDNPTETRTLMQVGADGDLPGYLPSPIKQSEEPIDAKT